MDELQKIGAYEAKTRLPEFLRQVREGRAFTITQRGEPVAELVPAGTSARRRATQSAERMQLFMKRHGPIRGIDIKALIEDGRD